MRRRIREPRGPVQPQRHGDAHDQRLGDVHVRVVKELVEVQADEEQRADAEDVDSPG